MSGKRRIVEEGIRKGSEARLLGPIDNSLKIQKNLLLFMEILSNTEDYFSKIVATNTIMFFLVTDYSKLIHNKSNSLESNV